MQFLGNVFIVVLTMAVRRLSMFFVLYTLLLASGNGSNTSMLNYKTCSNSSVLTFLLKQRLQLAHQLRTFVFFGIGRIEFRRRFVHIAFELFELLCLHHVAPIDEAQLQLQNVY